MSNFHKVWWQRHSWIWSATCVAMFYQNSVRISRPRSCLIGNCKYDRNDLAMISNVVWEAISKFTYHFIVVLVNFLLQRWRRNEYSTILLEENHWWNDMMSMVLLVRSNPYFNLILTYLPLRILCMVIHPMLLLGPIIDHFLPHPLCFFSLSYFISTH